MVRRKTERRRKALLQAAQRSIRERYSEFGLGLADIAEDVGVSPRQLQRVFRELADTEFRAYLLGVRMQHAHRLLSRWKTGLTVRATAPLVGYRKASGLRQAFMRYYGYNPSEIETEGFDYNAAWRREEASTSVELD